MGFISLIILFLLWPIWLLIAALTIMLPVLHVALNVVAAVLAVVNLLFLTLLLVLRAKWKQSGRMEKSYISSFTGWKYYGLLAAKIMLTAGVVWEVIMILLCGIFLVFQPLGYLFPM